MVRIYYSRRYYNPIKRKQYEESLEEHNIKTGSIEDNNINDDNIKNNSYDSLEINNYNEGLNKENTNTSKCRESDLCEIATDQVESLTEQISVTPAAITPTPVIVKIPVVLAETTITILVEATITLDQVVMEIKRIKNNVFLTQSRIISLCQDDRLSTGIIFIAGFIRKNIEYTTQTCTIVQTPNVCGDIRHCTVEVPFNFTTRITFLRAPIFVENTSPSELEFFTDGLKGCDVCSNPMIGLNPCEQSSFSTEFFNEKPFVELVRADIAEVDIHKNPVLSCTIPIELMFTEFTEKVVLNLTLKVLQKQQVRIIDIGL